MTRTKRKNRYPIERTRLSIAIGVVAILLGVAAVLLTKESIDVTTRTFGVFVARGQIEGGLSPLMLTYMCGATLVLGGIGALVPATWGWWAAAAGALFGVLDLFRIYRGLYQSINWDHPEVETVVGKLVLFSGVPALLYVALLVLLLLRPVRLNYRVTR